MPRFFVDKENILGGAAHLTGEDAHHASRSLRMRVGEKIVICDGGGTDYNCVIDRISSSDVSLRIVETSPTLSEPPYRAVVFQALARGDKVDTVVRKAVEYGAVRIVPFSSERCGVELSRDDGERKAARWRKIAREAAMQSMRGMIPEVASPISFDEMIQQASECDLSLFCWERASKPLKGVLAGSSFGSIAVIIGPEGGFSVEEAEAAAHAGAAEVSLGRRILRTESAAQFVLACLSYEYEQGSACASAD